MTPSGGVAERPSPPSASHPSNYANDCDDFVSDDQQPENGE